MGRESKYTTNHSNHSSALQKHAGLKPTGRPGIWKIGTALGRRSDKAKEEEKARRTGAWQARVGAPRGWRRSPSLTLFWAACTPISSLSCGGSDTDTQGRGRSVRAMPSVWLLYTPFPLLFAHSLFSTAASTSTTMAKQRPQSRSCSLETNLVDVRQEGPTERKAMVETTRSATI